MVGSRSEAIEQDEDARPDGTLWKDSSVLQLAADYVQYILDNGENRCTVAEYLDDEGIYMQDVYDPPSLIDSVEEAFEEILRSGLQVEIAKEMKRPEIDST